MKKSLLLFSLFFPLLLTVHGQENLLDQLKKENNTEWTPPSSTFKAVRLINGHTVETRKRGNLEFLISHRFGSINTGAYEFFGMDEANMRLGLDYSVKDWLTIGVGRSSFNKIYDGFAKISIFQQSQHNSGMPITVVWVSNTAIKTLKRPELPMNIQRRLSFAHQILLARKMNHKAAFQLMPTYIHRNLVTEREENNDLFTLGAGLGYKITKSVHLTMEYFHHLANQNKGYTNPLSIGVDIETGGHVFQLHLTNAQEMTETGFIPSTTGDLFNGDIHFGFNITRNFQLKSN
ncbi:DUF5777 family beta-barrel protein [Cyclobacterium amurskyense]|uniref:DUF5777 domain-containing protein n=1 Tax=Cyclobacterium amurskyense TaxID=320787 RepID=A0A0H4Q0F6_9BACT|nr:DUF5777 family beta-barrel protein [Cyclobacterium amurskyense]AKP54112.1 hypothetical protein CA2015_4788 [Cyclobacterium amurskyense]|tara:strand:- start:739 stop:1611 length:873 start_codon:yes stop_codon:yes gene_type:complete